jgi:hypothetical protein
VPGQTGLWEAYRHECIALGKPDPGPETSLGPVFLWVAEDVEAAWQMLMPHVLNQITEYAGFMRESYGQDIGPYRGAADPAAVRANPAYRVLTPEEAISLGNSLGSSGRLYVSPLLGGVPIDAAWRMLRLFDLKVRPHLPA